MKIKKYICLLLAALCFLSVTCAAVSSDTSSDTEQTENDKIYPTGYTIPEDENMTVDSKYALLYSEYDDRFLFAKNEKDTVDPMSTTKTMVGIMIFEKFGDKLDTEITVTNKLLAGKEGLSSYLEPGEVFTLRQLLTILLMYGSNDVSTILAHYYMQDTETEENDLAAFAELMTKRAKEIGCENTVFKNVTGLSVKGAVTTLHDIIKIAIHASNIPGFLEMTSTERMIIEANGPTNRHITVTRNHLLNKNQSEKYAVKEMNVTGMCFGSTEDSSECLLVSAEYRGKRYYAIIMGGYVEEDGTQVVFTDAIKLLDYARTGFDYIDVLKKGVIMTQVKVRFSSNTDVVTLVPEKTVSMYLPKNTNVAEEITFKTIVTDEAIDAPVAQGYHAGDVAVIYNEAEICRVPLVTTVSVSQSRILVFLDKLENFVKKPIVIASFISFFVFLVIFIVVKSIIEGQKKKRKRLK